MPDVTVFHGPNSTLESLGLITESELAAALGVQVKTLQNWRSRRIGPAFIRRAKAIFYERDDVIAWMRAQKHDTLDTAA